MKTLVDRKLFLAALDIIGTVVAGDEERFGSVVVFRVRDGRLVLGATDSVTFVETEVLASEVEAGAGDPNAAMAIHDKVKRVVTNADSDKLELSYDSGEVRIVTGDGGDVSFDSVTLQSYPWFDEAIESSTSSGTCLSSDLHATLTFLRPFVATKAADLNFTVAESRVVKVAGVETKVVLATDKMRLAVWNNPRLSIDLRVPHDQAPRLVTILGKREPTASVDVRDGKNHAVFQIVGPEAQAGADGAVIPASRVKTTFGFLKPEARFPADLKNFPVTIPNPSPQMEVVRFSKSAMKRAIECILAPLDSSSSHSITMCVSGVGEGGRIRLTAKHPTGKKDPQWELTAVRLPGGPDPSVVVPVLLVGETLQGAMGPLPGDEVLMAINSDPSQKWIQLSGIVEGDEGARASVLINRRREK